MEDENLFHFKVEGEVPKKSALELIEYIRKLGGRVAFEAMSELVSPSVALDLIADKKRAGLHSLAVTKDSILTFFQEVFGMDDSQASTQANYLMSIVHGHILREHTRSYGYQADRQILCGCPLVGVEGASSIDYGVDPLSLIQFVDLAPEEIKTILSNGMYSFGKKRLEYLYAVTERIKADLHVGKCEMQSKATV